MPLPAASTGCEERVRGRRAGGSARSACWFEAGRLPCGSGGGSGWLRAFASGDGSMSRVS